MGGMDDSGTESLQLHTLESGTSFFMKLGAQRFAKAALRDKLRSLLEIKKAARQIY